MLLLRFKIPPEMRPEAPTGQVGRASRTRSQHSPVVMALYGLCPRCSSMTHQWDAPGLREVENPASASRGERLLGWTAGLLFFCLVLHLGVIFCSVLYCYGCCIDVDKSRGSGHFWKWLFVVHVGQWWGVTKFTQRWRIAQSDRSRLSC